MDRRWGSKFQKRGIYRDSVRSSHSHFVKCSGLDWICLLLLMPIHCAGWVLSERYALKAGRRHKKITDCACQLLLQVKRWLPGLQVMAVGD